LITPDHERFEELLQQFPANPGTRAFIHITATRVSDSCGFSVPYYQYVSDRDVLDKWAVAQGPAKVAEYGVRKNQRSIDGLPAFDAKGH